MRYLGHILDFILLSPFQNHSTICTGNPTRFSLIFYVISKIKMLLNLILGGQLLTAVKARSNESPLQSRTKSSL